MAYTKQDWSTGDKITAEKLNHMEDGISNALTEVDASELVDSNSLIKAENNKLDVKYDELKGDIATDITTGSNYIDDVNGKIDVDYNSLKTALDADLLTSNDSTLKNMCGSSLQITDSKLEVNIEFLAGEGLMASQSNKFEVDLATVGGDLVENSNYLIAEDVNGTTTLDVNMDTLPSALAGYCLEVDQDGKIGVDTDVLSVPSIYPHESMYGDYVIITDSHTMLTENVPTLDYMENYVAEQGGGGGGTSGGNVYYGQLPELGGSDNYLYHMEESDRTILTGIIFYNGGQCIDYTSNGGNTTLPIIQKDSTDHLFVKEGSSNVYNPNVVYHDTDGFYTLTIYGQKQYITA